MRRGLTLWPESQLPHFLAGGPQQGASPHLQDGYKTFLGGLSVRRSKVPLETRLRTVILPGVVRGLVAVLICR